MEAATQPRNPNALRELRVALWILLFLAGTEFVVRGPTRFLSGPAQWNDLSQNYTASRLWLRSQNPSDPRNFVTLWKQEAGSRLELSDVRTHSAQPPGTFVILAPIAAFPWPVAKVLWLGVLLISFATTVGTLIQISGLRDDPLRTLVFITVCLALAPFQTGIANGNASILVIGVCVLAISAAGSRRDLVAGLLFGLACSLKPHVGSFLVLYYVLHRRWRLLVTALAFTAVLALAAILWLHLHGVSWRQDYFHNLKILATENKIDDFTSANPSRFMLINLQAPLYSFTGSARSANILAWSGGVLLVGAWMYLITRRATPGKGARMPVTRGHESRLELLAVGTIGVIGLMSVYHRIYDASLLAIPLCWCIRQRTGELKNTALIALLLMTPFLFPGTALLQQLAAQGRVPVSWTHSWWWDRIVMPHETWTLLLLCLVLLYGIEQDVSGAATS
jgi:hypothetical protein